MSKIYTQRMKQMAYDLDPKAWVSYSGKNREIKRGIEVRRIASLEQARKYFSRRPGYRWPSGRGSAFSAPKDSWWRSPAMYAVLMQRQFDETGMAYLRRMAEAEGLRLDQYAMLAYCAALSQGRKEWRSPW